MVKSKGLDHSHGLTVECTEDSGKMGSRMVEEFSFPRMEFKGQEYGVMAKRFVGLTDFTGF